MISGTLDRHRRERVSTDSGAITVHRNYIITSPIGGLPSPQAYLIEQAPNSTLRPHFHFNSQFQIFVAGAGTIGRNEAKPYVVQYAGRQTGYGPIIAGGGGLEYLTLRPTSIKDRAQYMPESRDLVDRSVTKRQAVSQPVEQPLAAGSGEPITMIEPTADGLGAWFVHVAAGSHRSAPIRANGSGRFHVIVAGRLVAPEGTREALSVIWTDQDEPPLELSAAEEDLDVIVVQFPIDAW